jgi:hypothetical protein
MRASISEVIVSNVAFAFISSFAPLPLLSEEQRDSWIEDLYLSWESADQGTGLVSMTARASVHLGR